MDKIDEDIWPLRYYGELKNKLDGAVLMFPRGDLYCMYYGDAFDVAKATGIPLSRSNGGNGHYLADIPQKSLNDYRSKLATAGLKVAICDDETVEKLVTDNYNIKDTAMDKNMDPAMSARIATLLYLLPDEGKKISFNGKIPLDDMIKAMPISSAEIESIKNIGNGKFVVSDAFSDHPFEELSGEQQELMVAKALIWSNDNMKKNGAVISMFNALDECRAILGNEFSLNNAFLSTKVEDGTHLTKAKYIEEDNTYLAEDDNGDEYDLSDVDNDTALTIAGKAYISLIHHQLGDEGRITLKEPFTIKDDSGNPYAIKEIEEDKYYGIAFTGDYTEKNGKFFENENIEGSEILDSFSAGDMKKLADHVMKESIAQDQRPLIKVVFDESLSNSRGRDYYLGDNGRYFTRQPEGAIQYDNNGKAIKDNWQWVICTDNCHLEPDYAYDKYARFEIVDSLKEKKAQSVEESEVRINPDKGKYTAPQHDKKNMNSTTKGKNNESVSSDSDKKTGMGWAGFFNGNGTGSGKPQVQTAQEPVDVQKTLHDNFEKLMKESEKEEQSNHMKR